MTDFYMAEPCLAGVTYSVYIQQVFGGKVVLHGPECPQQMFSVILEEEDPERCFRKTLLEALPSFDSVMKAADFHTEGEVNKEYMHNKVNALLTAAKIDPADAASLHEYIGSCDCPPKKVIQKLEKKGFDGIFEELEIWAPSEAHTFTAKILWSFMHGDSNVAV